MPRPVFPPAKGAGWGGPAKGPGNGNPRAQEFQPGQMLPGSAPDFNHDPAEQRYRQERKAWKRELRERMMQVLIQHAEDENNEGSIRIVAADKVLDRLDGKPAPMSQNIAIADEVSAMTDAELAAEILRLQTIGGEAGAR